MKAKLSLAVVGSRSFRNEAMLATWIEFCLHGVMPAGIEIVSGGARGADRMAAKYAFDNRLPYVEFPADWESYGKRAGMIRNAKIVKRADTVLAFWDGCSTGTADTINKAIVAKKPVIIIPFGGNRENHTRLLFD